MPPTGPSASPHPVRGVALVFAAAVVSLLALLFLSYLGMVRFHAARAENRSALTRANLAAESGLQYAAARLLADPWPRPAFPIRSEDWSSAPAYGRGAPWSGRIRGGSGSPSLFTLKIASPSGRIPVNAGFLGVNYYGPPVVPDPPHHRDPGIAIHRGLVHALNNLGVVLRPDPSGPWRWRWDLPTTPGGHVFRCSWLGFDLVENRPAGGYRSPDEVKSTLARLGYSEAEQDRIAPFLDVGPYDGPAESARLGLYEDGQTVFPNHPPVNLATAPREVLQALLMYLACEIGTEEFMAFLGTEWSDPSSRTGGGLRFNQLGWGPNVKTLILYDDEAGDIADTILALRWQAPLCWKELYRRLAQEAGTLFQADAADLASTQVLKHAWPQAKTDLAFRALAPDGIPYRTATLARSVTWAGWGIDRFPWPLLPQGAFAGGLALTHAIYPEAPGAPTWTFQGGNLLDPADPFRQNEASLTGVHASPLGGTIRAPGRFRVQALGTDTVSRGFLQGEIRTDQHLEFSCQEDFENYTGSPNLGVRYGIRAVEDTTPADRRDVRAALPLAPGGPRPVYLDDAGASAVRRFPHVISFPRRNRRGVSPGLFAGLDWNARNFSRNCGALSLATLEGGLQGATLYWAQKEDFDGALDNGGIFTPGERGDFWHEAAPGYTGVPRYPLNSRGSMGSLWENENPLAMNATTVSLRVPGFHNAPFPWGEPVSCSVEAWLGASSGRLELDIPMSGNQPEQIIRLTASRTADVGPPARSGTSFRLELPFDYTPPPAPPFPPVPPHADTWTVWDADLAGGLFASMNPWCHHVVVNIAPGETGYTKFELLVDGGAGCGGFQRLITMPAPVLGVDPSTWDGFSFNNADEIRLYGRCLAPSEVADRFKLGRHVRRGVFSSPCYVPAEPVRVGRARWTGLIPSGFREALDPADPVASPLGGAIDPFTVSVEGYGSIPGEPNHPRLLWRCPLGPAGPEQALPPLPSARSFRYVVDMDCRRVAGVLTDSPFFESIDLVIRPRGFPRWTE